MRWTLACLLAAGCGRLGFDDRFQLAGDDTVMPDGPANLVFVTSQHVVVGQLGSLAAADATCNQAAAGAGLPGHYVAWLSTSKTSAIDRLAGARGWVRPDGRPFADTPADIAAGRIWYPASIDEHGAVSATLVVTTSDAHGRFDGMSCNDLTDDSIDGVCDIGESTGTTGTFSSYPLFGGGLCFLDEPMYCFATDRSVRVQPPRPRTGVRVFPAEGFTPGGGLAGADALCARTAATAGVTGAFRALLATAAMPAAARFDPAAGPVVRPDGIEIAASVGDLFAGRMASAANATLDGRYLGGPVWTGAESPASPARTAPCGDWAQSAGPGPLVGELASAQAGFFGLIDISGFHNGRTRPCNTSLPIYCLEH